MRNFAVPATGWYNFVSLTLAKGGETTRARGMLVFHAVLECYDGLMIS
jgi:hypothetical protein